MDDLTAKWLHILSATLLFGAGVGSAFHPVLAVGTRDVHDIAATARHVIVQDWVFTATTAVFQPLSGFWLLRGCAISRCVPRNPARPCRAHGGACSPRGWCSA